jgi:hypothetical protein
LKKIRDFIGLAQAPESRLPGLLVTAEKSSFEPALQISKIVIQNSAVDFENRKGGYIAIDL